ncbi:MAG: serine/threonine-protein kinase, partial [Planctomycetota bacterium]
LVGRTIDRFELVELIARGGMGSVYLAKQEDLQRRVAIKLISAGVLATSEERSRFRTEAESAAQLNHPGIVAIHEIGDWQGHAYMVMQLIDGPTLSQWAIDTSRSDEERVAVLIAIADAVQYAHARGIIHRDLKPDNVLMDDGHRPLLTDFGLARWHAENHDAARTQHFRTQTGQLLGTPHYMAPEQTFGDPSSVTTAVDTYALGAIAYHLFTGQTPHCGDTAVQVILSVQQNDPPLPRSWRRDIPADLETIIVRCMARDPADRYPSAGALASDLRRFRDGESIENGGVSWMRNISRVLERDANAGAFQKWGTALFSLAVIVFVTHILLFALAVWRPTAYLEYWIVRAAMFVGIIGTIVWFRSGDFLPRSSAERPLWSIWCGYIIAQAISNGLVWYGDHPHNHSYLHALVLSGFGFIAMAGNVWGGCYLLGAAFLAAVIPATMFPEFGSLILGTTWLISLSVLGRRYR